MAASRYSSNKGKAPVQYTTMPHLHACRVGNSKQSWVLLEAPAGHRGNVRCWKMRCLVSQLHELMSGSHVFVDNG